MTPELFQARLFRDRLLAIRCGLLAVLMSVGISSVASSQENTAALNNLKEKITLTLRDSPVEEQDKLLEDYVALRNLTYTDEFSGELTFNPDNSTLVNVVIINNRYFENGNLETITSMLQDAMRKSCGSEYQLTLQAAGFTQRVVFFNESHEILVGAEIQALRSDDTIAEIQADKVEWDDLNCVREFGWQRSVFSEWLDNAEDQNEKCVWSIRLWFSDVTTVDHHGARWTNYTADVYREILAAENAFCKD